MMKVSKYISSEVLDLISELRSRKVSIDDGPDGRGGWYSHDAPDKLCSKAADILEQRQTISTEVFDKDIDHLTQLLDEARRVYAAAESAGVCVQVGHYRRLTEGSSCLLRVADFIEANK